VYPLRQFPSFITTPQTQVTRTRGSNSDTGGLANSGWLLPRRTGHWTDTQTIFATCGCGACTLIPDRDSGEPDRRRAMDSAGVSFLPNGRTGTSCDWPCLLERMEARALAMRTSAVAVQSSAIAMQSPAGVTRTLPEECGRRRGACARCRSAPKRRRNEWKPRRLSRSRRWPACSRRRSRCKRCRKNSGRCRW
jgi:hypothetical protein